MKNYIKPKISVAMIAKNSQDHIESSLKSVAWADEIVVIVDKKSSDNTLKIAQKYATKVIEQEWLGFAKQKNFAINETKNNWVLSLDADEIVSVELMSAIYKADLVNYSGFYLSRKNYFGKSWVKYCGWYPDWQLRLFNKKIMNFEDKIVHEHIKPKGKTGYLKGDIIHYSYDSKKDYFEKLEKYTDLDAKHLFDQKRKWSMAYQIGKPVKEFFYKYIEQQGILDGGLGFKISLFSAYYKWQVCKKLKELENEDRN